MLNKWKWCALWEWNFLISNERNQQWISQLNTDLQFPKRHRCYLVHSFRPIGSDFPQCLTRAWYGKFRTIGFRNRNRAAVDIWDWKRRSKRNEPRDFKLRLPLNRVPQLTRSDLPQSVADFKVNQRVIFTMFYKSMVWIILINWLIKLEFSRSCKLSLKKRCSKRIISLGLMSTKLNCFRLFKSIDR